MERPSLYVVATPIGNLADITLRALDVLKRVAVVAAEDTRVTGRLLCHYGIATPLMAVHEHNERGAAQKIVQALERGTSVALVTDAGTPGISDPGAIVVASVRAAGFPVVPLPGANAAVCALSVGGSPAPHFLFYGFLPQQASARRRELERLKAVPFQLVFYEAPHRVIASMADMAAVLGAARTVTLARELTKLFESVHVCSLGAAAQWLAADPNRTKGEFVVLVEGAPLAQEAEKQDMTRMLEVLLEDLPLKQAVTLTAKLTGARKNAVYEQALALKQQSSA